MFRRLLLAAFLAFSGGVAFMGGVMVHKYRAAIRARLQTLQSSSIIQTNLYNLRIQKLAVPGEGRDGAIEVLGDGILFVNRKGNSWFVTKDREVRQIALRAPINFAEFESDPSNALTTDQDRFSVKDLLVQPTAAGVRIFASHMYWQKEKQCNSLRVSVLETTADAVQSGQSGPGQWRQLLETSCRELNKSADNRSRHVTLGVGGRLAALSDSQILLTLGEFVAEYASGSGGEQASDLYGKTVLIDVATGAPTEFTRGHRNAQGITVGPDGRVWLTEHAARGGDELNLLVKGRHYGAPHVTYGTQYEMMVWPRSKTQGKHEGGYTKPVYSWVPSVAPSQLLVIQANAFPWWTGDLLMSTLESRTLYRIRVEDERVIFAEPITIGHRMRDIIETGAGTIVLKTDDNYLVYIDNVDTAPAASLDPPTRGGIVAGQCRSCHNVQAGAPSGIGPNLFGVIGRRVASASGYAYSDALKRAGGSWTPERLSAYVADPGQFAPGTRMEIVTKYSEQQLSDLIAYLQTLR